MILPSPLLSATCSWKTHCSLLLSLSRYYCCYRYSGHHPTCCACCFYGIGSSVTGFRTSCHWSRTPYPHSLCQKCGSLGWGRPWSCSSWRSCWGPCCCCSAPGTRTSTHLPTLCTPYGSLSSRPIRRLLSPPSTWWACLSPQPATCSAWSTTIGFRWESWVISLLRKTHRYYCSCYCNAHQSAPTFPQYPPPWAESAPTSVISPSSYPHASHRPSSSPTPPSPSPPRTAQSYSQSRSAASRSTAGTR